MANICEITGKHLITGNNVSNACNKVRRKFYPNLVRKKIYVEEIDAFIQLKIAHSTQRTITKNGLIPVLRKAHKKGTLSPNIQSIAALLISLPPVKRQAAKDSN